ncbi:MAG: hypothetical protein IPH34_01385 [Chitinophagaceae bacterium]|nr:hypothetical protein [Chitinophagaceae bacterium]MBK8311658.1 hypothetical protein [Chitinophagaceae bacterium]MBK8605772.1 hypothetical protein [Chitinophagaceae bacterium]MBP7107485.1 hypothetical protein [Chitinophagaceae bacterium]HQX97102.1 hypothetical protein [Chitinophagaceae bacterium]
MAKAKKAIPKKKAVKKKSKYDITVKAPEGMTFEELLKLAATTPLPKKKKK